MEYSAEQLEATRNPALFTPDQMKALGFKIYFSLNPHLCVRDRPSSLSEVIACQEELERHYLQYKKMLDCEEAWYEAHEENARRDAQMAKANANWTRIARLLLRRENDRAQIDMLCRNSYGSFALKSSNKSNSKSSSNNSSSNRSVRRQSA